MYSRASSRPIPDDVLDGGRDVLDGPVGVDDRDRVGRLRHQRLIPGEVPLGVRPLDGVGHRLDEQLRRHVVRHEVLRCPLFHRLDGVRAVVEPGEHDHRRRVIPVQKRPQVRLVRVLVRVEVEQHRPMGG